MFVALQPHPRSFFNLRTGLRGQPAVKRGRGRPHLSFAEASLLVGMKTFLDVISCRSETSRAGRRRVIVLPVDGYDPW